MTRDEFNSLEPGDIIGWIHQGKVLQSVEVTRPAEGWVIWVRWLPVLPANQGHAWSFFDIQGLENRKYFAVLPVDLGVL